MGVEREERVGGREEERGRGGKRGGGRERREREVRVRVGEEERNRESGRGRGVKCKIRWYGRVDMRRVEEGKRKAEQTGRVVCSEGLLGAPSVVWHEMMLMSARTFQPALCYTVHEQLTAIL